ncbi:Outer dense fiber protein 3-like protein 2 [Myotis davidii]|uniref:Outer dense fiber protein 3-like protein 2 n=1 Tax=Myotis davidii TaxID=225400 RepID=L5LVA2_MYODS|nr:Outer dense fiber protein 3-like protein 2 [Myotis davidii]
MGTLSCDPTPRQTPAPLGRRCTECQIPETGLRKTCRMATLENGDLGPGRDLGALVTGSGPGLYALPSTVGYINHDCTRVASPAYSLLRRPSQACPQDSSPGPVYFLDPKVTRFGRSCAPAYSMQGRGKSRGLEVTPGPGAYSPEKVAPVRQRTPPAFTLGSRLRPPPLDTSAPAPNAYTLPSLWGAQIFIKPSSPSYTVVGRTPPARPPQDPTEIPGPGQYESSDPNAYRQRPPAFTMLGRPRAPHPLEETPGPGTHSPERVTVTKARAPAFTMGIRHSKRATTMAPDTPAPFRLWGAECRHAGQYLG